MSEPDRDFSAAVRRGESAAADAAPMRVAVVAACPFPERRGTPVRIQRIAEGLQRRGHEVHVVTYPFGTGTLDAPLAVHRVSRGGTRYRSLPGPSIGKLAVLDPLLVRLLRRVLCRTRPDVVHAHHYEGLLVAAAARIGTDVPLIYDAHTLLESELPSYGPRVPASAKRIVGRTLDRWLPGRADHVISVTETIRETLLARTGLGQDDVTTVSNGVELELFDCGAGTDGGLAQGVDGGHPPTVVFSGNLARYQGIDLLLHAFREVLAQKPATRLRIVTESSFGGYEELARELGVRQAVDVIASGFEGVPRLLASADVAVNPRSECHGIPLKLLNYMAASKPVVSFREAAPGVEHGRTGWIVEKGDVPAFAAGILTLLDDPARAGAIGAAARVHVEANHSWQAVAEITEAVYRRVIARMGAASRPAREVTGASGAAPVAAERR